jgi:16S rRNA (adenine1518-N6/adenine1519-N6)-dimethyltransferase
MSLTVSEIKEILERENFRPLRQLGQNFLIDQNICQFIVNQLPAPAGASVLEIGPGLGALTDYMLKKQWEVTCLEIDKGFCKFLKIHFQDFPNFHLIEGDALENLLLQAPHDYVIGNLPYKISTPLLVTLFTLPHLPKHCVFTLQKEVGLRLIAPFKTKDYGAVTAFAQTLYDIRLIKTLKGSVFYPAPEVDSVVLEFKLKANSFTPEERKNFYQFLRQGFSQRRKMIKKVLPIDSNLRAEEISPTEWKKLYESTRGHL